MYDKFKPNKPTPAEITAYQQKKGVPLEAAKAYLDKKALAESLLAVTNNGTPGEKIEWLLFRYAEDKGLHFTQPS